MQGSQIRKAVVDSGKDLGFYSEEREANRGFCVCVCVCVCVSFVFLGPHLRHMEVPRPGV